jgi:hypothetical protein
MTQGVLTLAVLGNLLTSARSGPMLAGQWFLPVFAQSEPHSAPA